MVMLIVMSNLCVSIILYLDIKRNMPNIFYVLTYFTLSWSLLLEFGHLVLIGEDHVLGCLSRWPPKTLSFHHDGYSGANNPLSAAIFPLSPVHQSGLASFKLGLHLARGHWLHSCRFLFYATFFSSSVFF